MQVLNVKHFWLQHNLKHIKTHPVFAQSPSFNSTLFDANWFHPWPPLLSPCEKLIGRRVGLRMLWLAVQNINQTSQRLLRQDRLGSDRWVPKCPRDVWGGSPRNSCLEAMASSKTFLLVNKRTFSPILHSYDWKIKVNNWLWEVFVSSYVVWK